MGHGRQVYGEVGHMRQETRPWGRFEVIYENDNMWLKRIIINPGESLSYQKHYERTEYWVPETPGVWMEVRGKKLELKHSLVPMAVYPQVEHRLFNPCEHEVSVIEWAVGHPQEADIVRIHDLYGR